MPMAIFMPAQRYLRIVEMEHMQALKTNMLLYKIDETPHALRSVDLIPCGPRMRGIHTDAQLRVIDRAKKLSQLLDRAAYQLPRPCGILQHQNNARRDVFQHALQRLDNRRKSFFARSLSV